MSLSLAVDNQVAQCRLDSGSVNAFSRRDIQELDAILTKCESMFPEVRILRLVSDKVSPKGHRIFCAGADQKERVEWSVDSILEHLVYQRMVIHRFRTSPLVIISCVDGLALGLGAEICLASDFVMASEASAFAFPEKNWGIVPGAGGYAWAHGWAAHPDAAQIVIETGNRFDREYAQWLGIVDTCCDSNDFALMESYVLNTFCVSEPWDWFVRKKKCHEKIDYMFWFDMEQTVYASKLREKLACEVNN